MQIPACTATLNFEQVFWPLFGLSLFSPMISIRSRLRGKATTTTILHHHLPPPPPPPRETMPNNNMYGAPAVLGDMGHPYSTDEQASPSYEGSAPYTLPPPPPPYCQSPSSSSTSSSSHPANEDMSGPAPMMYLGPDQLPQIIQHYGPPYYGPPPDYKRVSNRGPLRKGKWTHEEEEYAHYIIENFNKGLIDLPRGTTLRSYLSEMLNW